LADARRGDDQGLTLIEMLVVLAIIAVIASVSVLAIGSGEGLDGRAESKRLEARLQLAADHTMIEDRQLALAVSATGYGFLERDANGGEWHTSTLPSLSQAHRLPKGVELRVAGGESIFPLGADAAGQGFSLTVVDENRSWTVDFDGMTARQSAPGPAGGVSARTGM